MKTQHSRQEKRLGFLKKKKEKKTIGVFVCGQEWGSLVLDLLSLRCLLNIQIEIFRYLDLNFREEVQAKDINLAGRHQNTSKYNV